MCEARQSILVETEGHRSDIIFIMLTELGAPFSSKNTRIHALTLTRVANFMTLNAMWQTHISLSLSLLFSVSLSFLVAAQPTSKGCFSCMDGVNCILNLFEEDIHQWWGNAEPALIILDWWWAPTKHLMPSAMQLRLTYESMARKWIVLNNEYKLHVCG